MRSEGIRGSYVGATSGIPLPPAAPMGTPSVGLVTCSRCDLRTRPGAFHICLGPAAPEPVVTAPQPEPKADPPKPKKRRGGKPALNEEQSIEAARLYVEQGMSMLAVADHFRVSQNCVHNALKRLAVPRRPAGGRHPRGGSS